MKKQTTKNEFFEIKEKIKTNPYEAKFLLEEYLQKYPRNTLAKSYLIYTLLILGRVELAEIMNNELEEEIETNIYLLNRPEKLEYIRNNIKINKLRILARKRKYQEFIDYADQISEKINYNSWFFSQYKLGQINKQENLSYYCSQIVNYQESLFQEHAKRHRAINNHYIYKPNNSIFMSDFPLEEIISEMKSYIPSDQKLCYGYFDDTYNFGYTECGIANGKVVDTFRVISLADDEFHPITMYPVDTPDSLYYIDLNYMKNSSKPKIKTLSQIEKFNQRYKQ